MQNQVRKVRFFSCIRISVGLLFLFLALLVTGFQVFTATREGTAQADLMRSEYIGDQRQSIKYEVDRVVKVIDYEAVKHAS